MTNPPNNCQLDPIKCKEGEECIGNLIFNRLLQTEHSIVWLARKLHCSRTNVYNIFQKTNLDVELLKRISVILNFNFFEEICEETQAKILENQHESLAYDSQSLTSTDEPSASKSVNNLFTHL